MTVSTTQTRTVLYRSHVTNFRPKEEEGARDHELYLDKSEWKSLGKPDVVTVTVEPAEPGDLHLTDQMQKVVAFTDPEGVSGTVLDLDRQVWKDMGRPRHISIRVGAGDMLSANDPWGAAPSGRTDECIGCIDGPCNPECLPYSRGATSGRGGDDV